MRTTFTVAASVIGLLSATTAFASSIPPSIEEAYSVAMEYVQSHEMLQPLEDGSMHPELPLTRRDLLLAVVNDVYSKDVNDQCFSEIAPSVPAKFDFLFSDVSRNSSIAKEVCAGMFVGILNGIDGRLRLDEKANLVDTAKVITKAYGIAPLPGLRPDPAPWHEPFWYALARRNAIPKTVTSRSSSLTRGEFAEIIYRLQGERPSVGVRYSPTVVQMEWQAPAHSKHSVRQVTQSPVIQEPVIVHVRSAEASAFQGAVRLLENTEARRDERLARKNTVTARLAP